MTCITKAFYESWVDNEVLHVLDLADISVTIGRILIQFSDYGKRRTKLVSINNQNNEVLLVLANFSVTIGRILIQFFSDYGDPTPFMCGDCDNVRESIEKDKFGLGSVAYSMEYLSPLADQT